MPPITVGVTLHPQHTSMGGLLDAFARADDLGVDAAYLWDHFFPMSGDPDGASFECWTTLTAVGLRTRRATVGPLVLGMGYRNPALLSAMAKTLDHALGGRLVLGLGAGWVERDYREYGYAFGTPGDRLRLLEAGIETIRHRWAADNPRPVRGTIPILIGGGGERVTLRIAARHADMWHGFGLPDAWAHKSQVLDDWCARLGRDPNAITRGVTVADARNEPRLGPATVDEALLDAYAAAGATHLVYGAVAPYDLSPVERILEWRSRRALG